MRRLIGVVMKKFGRKMFGLELDGAKAGFRRRSELSWHTVALIKSKHFTTYGKAAMHLGIVVYTIVEHDV
jgi:hypothetical protein